MMNDKGLILVVALLIDIFMGDPPNRWHPVAWMGNFISLAQKNSPTNGRHTQLIYGGLISLAGAGVFGGAAWFLNSAVSRLPRPLNWLLGGLALKTTFSLRGLVSAAASIRRALENGDITEARRLLNWHLVSRDTSDLSESQVAAATIESVTENTSDSIIAPLFYYSVAGLPGAFTYRFANTADAMLGYRDPHREWLGKIPARVDDLLNLLPARISAFLFIAASYLTGLEIQQAWSIWLKDRNKTESPNAGQPMSAAAGALGVRLEKVGHYILGDGLREPSSVDIHRSLHLVGIATIVASILALVFLQRGRK